MKTLLIAPSHKINKELIVSSKNNGKKNNFEVVALQNILEDYLDFAGSAKRRAEEIMHGYTSSEIKILWAAIGGNGAIETLPYLKFHRMQNKILIGYSDITILLNVIFEKTGFMTIHGPNLANKQKWKKEELSSLLNCINKTKYKIPIKRYNKYFKKEYTGLSKGGCLSVIAYSMGTPYEIKTENSILFLEDYELKGRTLHNYLVQMHLTRKFENCCVVIGDFKNCVEGKKYVWNFFENNKIPAVEIGNFGHDKINIPFPIGVNTKVSKEITFFYQESLLPMFE